MHFSRPICFSLLAAFGLGALETGGLALGPATVPTVLQPVARRAASAGRPSGDEPFNAAAAWAEFTELLRTNYAYFTRPGVEGNAILAYFEPQATAAKTKEAFRDVLQLVAHNFADPHFIVGPLDAHDYNVIPTSSDLVARYRAKRFELIDVRRDSDAEKQGIEPGAEIVAIEGQPPQAAVEAVMGRPLAALSPVQIDTGLNIALGGIRQHLRQLTLAVGSARHQYTLRSPGEQAERVRAAAPLHMERQGEVAVIRFNNSLGRNETIPAFQAALQQALTAKVLVLDLRNTPSGGNTTVARGIMGHFTQRERPYQVHVVPSEERSFGVPRKFVEYVLPLAPYYRGKVVVLGGHWTGSMGEGLMVGFDALGVKTAGSGLADLLGGLFNERLLLSDAKVDLGEEQLFQVNGQPRENFVPVIFREASEGHAAHDALLEQVIRSSK